MPVISASYAVGSTVTSRKVCSSRSSPRMETYSPGEKACAPKRFPASSSSVVVTCAIEWGHKFKALRNGAHREFPGSSALESDTLQQVGQRDRKNSSEIDPGFKEAEPPRRGRLSDSASPTLMLIKFEIDRRAQACSRRVGTLLR